MKLMTRSLAAAAIAIFASAWMLAVRHHAIDYDEIEHAHVVWLIHQHKTPFVDFFECHPPFMWYALRWAPAVASNPGDLLMVLRAISVVCNVAVLVLLALNVCTRHRVPVTVLIAALIIAAAAPENLAYLAEFRIDAFPLAVLLFAILISCLRIRHRFAVTAGAVCLSVLSVGAGPKYAVLAIAYWIGWLIEERATFRTSVIAAAVGLGLGLAIVAGAFVLIGVSLTDAYDLIVRFHAAFAKLAHFDRRLIEALPDLRFTFALECLAFLGWIVAVARKTVTLTSFEVALAVFLIVQAIVVPFPYKQYSAPWHILAICLLPVVLAPFRFAVPAVALAVACLVAAASLRVYRADQVTFEMRYLSTLEHLGVRGPVAAAVRLHPIAADDVFYGWVRSLDPAGPNDTERVMQRLGLKSWSDRFTKAYYRQELQRAAPQLIALGPSMVDQLSPDQMAVVSEYLRAHHSEYAAGAFGPWRLWIRRAR